MSRVRPDLALLLPLASACGGNADSIDRAAVYGEIATAVIAPSYADLRTTTAALDAAATTYCADPTSTTGFDSLRAAYVAAQTAYQRTLAFEFNSSPPKVALIPTYLETYPVSTTTGPTTWVDQLLAGSTTLDFVTLPVTVQGLYTVEYLIYVAPDATASIGTFTDAATGPRRCTYLTTLTARIASLGDSAADAWDPPSATTFGAQLATPGATSVYPTVGAVTTAILQRLYDLAHDLADVRLGRALGLVSTGTPTPNPDATPGHLADTTKADLLAALDGFENLYLGRYGAVDGRGLQDIVQTRAASRDTQLLAALADARAAIAAIPGDVDVAVADANSADYAAVMTAFDKLKTLQLLVGTGIGPLLGVSSAAFETDND